MDNEFERYFPDLIPEFIKGKWGTLFAQSLGFLFDNLIEGVKEGAKAGMVQLAPPDVITDHAASRLIEPLDGESTEALRSRVLDAWNHWGNSGSQSDLRDKLKAYTGAQDLIVQTPAFDSFILDPGDASRLWVICGTGGTLPWSQPAVGPGLVVGPGLMVGITMTERELHRIRRIVKRYKPAHVVGAELIVSFNSTAALWGGADQVIRIALNRQMVGYDSSEMTVGPALVVGLEYT